MTRLRIITLLTGLISILIGFYKLRSYEARPPAIQVFIIFGLALCLLGLFPDLANFPSHFIFLADIPGGRIITLLVILNVIFCFIFAIERGKSYRLRQEFDSLVRRWVVNEFIAHQSHPIFENLILVTIPAYNEAENLRTVLPKIPQALYGSPVQVLVINDGSTDDTESVALEHHTWVVNHSLNLGGGAALLTGYEIAKRLKASVVVTMDGDGQHKPEEIPILVKPVVQNEADIVIGSRFLGSYRDNSFIRGVGVIIYSTLINFLMGLKITDCTSGFRALDFSKLKNIRLEEAQFHTTEMIIDAAKNGLRVIEQPITIVSRLTGVSKKGWAPTYGLSVFFTIIRTWLR